MTYTACEEEMGMQERELLVLLIKELVAAGHADLAQAVYIKVKDRLDSGARPRSR